jgi:hypothetical protein
MPAACTGVLTGRNQREPISQVGASGADHRAGVLLGFELPPVSDLRRMRRWSFSNS